ncbi:MAG: histidine--tRNA ligase [Chloroflexi bacterium]|nr:histidine--tRNA ligase [Chloroflexota bacterium]
MAEQQNYRAPRGVADILPDDQSVWNAVKKTAINTARQFGYQQIDTPVFENTGLFRRGVGGETDIVQKEMYSFDDLGGESLTLRPEGTAPVCRSYIEHGMHNLPQPVRLYYIAPMFRYDRPQAGRYRQHHQFGCEAIGDPSPTIDAEIIEIGLHYITALGLSDVTVRINSIGDPETRTSYADDLRNHYAKFADDLPKVDRDRLERAPLRLLDSKEPATQKLSADAPKSLDYLSDEAQNHWENLLVLLDGLKTAYPNFSYRTDHTLVRGLDYYNRTVFEFEPSTEGSQTSLFGGGRYDPLIGILGGNETPGVGFGSGIERIILETQRQESLDVAEPPRNAVMVHVGDNATIRAAQLAAELRNHGISVLMAPAGKSMRAQMRYANRANANYAIIIGDREIEQGVAAVKPLQFEGDQKTLALDSATIANFIAPSE